MFKYYFLNYLQVPLADALNHVSDHNAELEFGPDVLIMRAIKSIPAGQEIYNTYGQISNYQLLQVCTNTRKILYYSN